MPSTADYNSSDFVSSLPARIGLPQTIIIYYIDVKRTEILYSVALYKYTQYNTIMLWSPVSLIPVRGGSLDDVAVIVSTYKQWLSRHVWAGQACKIWLTDLVSLGLGMCGTIKVWQPVDVASRGEGRPAELVPLVSTLPSLMAGCSP